MKRALVVLAACTGGGGGDAPIPLDVVDGRLFATVVVDGSAPIPVLVDTGSVGLRLFATDVSVTPTAEPASVELFGQVLDGHVATGTVQLGAVELPGQVAFQLVESGAIPGIHGILGIGLRAGSPASIYNPLAQITGITSYAIHPGSIELGADPGRYATHDVPPIGTLPDGLVAWSDDAVAACYTVGGSPIDPPCTATIVDSSSTVDVIVAPGLPAGPLPDGSAFSASFDPFVIDFTAGTTPGKDLVEVDAAAPRAILGVELFQRYDVVYDLATGAIGFRAI